MSNIIINIGKILLQYIWAPLLVIAIAWCCKKIRKSYLYVKEIKKPTDPDIEGFKDLYSVRIKDDMRIEAEEILKFIGRRDETDVEHHLYICKRKGKVVGFIKFMISNTSKILFIAYIAVDKNDRVSNSCGMEKMLKKVAKKQFKKDKVLRIVTEIEQGEKGNYNTPLSKIIARYARAYNHDAFYVDVPYFQPNMPGDDSKATKENCMSLIYVPYYKVENKVIPKTELINIIEFIYFEIYSPCCNELKCDCGGYNLYLTNIIDKYKSDFPDYIDLVRLGGSL